MVPRIEQLLIAADIVANKNEIVSLLNLADSIYYTGKSHVYNAIEYSVEDLPADETYDAFRARHTPDVVAGANLSPDMSPETEKVKHRFAMGKMRKYRPEDYKTLKNLYPNGDVLIMEKLDGISIRTTFNDAVLQSAVTRHNSDLGRVITAKASKFIKRPDLAISKGEIVIGGEAVYIGDGYKALGMSKRRSAAAGLIGRDSNQDYTNLEYIAFEIIQRAQPGASDHEAAPSILDQVQNLELLKAMGYRIPKYEVVQAADLTLPMLQDILKRWQRESANLYDIDGLVLVPRMYEFENSDLPVTKVSFKMQLAGEWTVVEEINARCTRTGLIIPHVTVRKVLIDGDEITHIAGANYDILREKEIVVGSNVYVIKSNSVIPFISQVDNSDLDGDPVIAIPTACPIDKTVLEPKGRMLYCPNPSCPAKSSGSVTHFFTHIGLDGFGKVLIGSLNLDSIEDAYALSIHQLEQIDGFGTGRATAFYEGIRKALINLEDSTLLTAFGINLISDKTSKLLMNKLNLNTLFMRKYFPYVEVSEIDGIGTVKADKLESFAPRAKTLITFLTSQGMKLVSRKKKIKLNTEVADKIFVFSGPGPSKGQSKAFYGERLEEAGAVVKSSVSGKTHYLVSNQEGKPTEKVETAKKLKVPIISYEELHRMLSLP